MEPPERSSPWSKSTKSNDSCSSILANPAINGAVDLRDDLQKEDRIKESLRELIENRR